MWLDWLIKVALIITICESKKPNILYILLDDWGWSDGLLEIGNGGDFELEYFKILSEDRGFKMSNYYTNPTCAPTRASLLTGKHAHRSGYLDPFSAHGGVGMNEFDKTLPEYLKEAGYYNVLSGKWHLGYTNEKYYPTNRGFDEAFWAASSTHTNQYNHTMCKHLSTMGVTNATVISNYQACTGTPKTCFYDIMSETSIDTNNGDYYQNTYDSDLWVNYIMDFLDDYYDVNDKNDPWFLFWSENAPHFPTVTPPTVTPFDPDNEVDYSNCDGLAPNRADYCRMLIYTELLIKIVIKKLESLDIYRDTLIIITSDNGAEPQNYSEWSANGQNLPLRGSKMSSFEGAIKVPCIVTGGFVKDKFHGETFNGLFHVTDWLPTFLNLIEQQDEDVTFSLTSDSSSFDYVNGINQWNNILNMRKTNYVPISSETKNEILFLQYYTHLQDYTNTYIRQGDWKLVLKGGNTGDNKDRYHIKYDGTIINDVPNISPYATVMLFNITSDPYEYYDLSSQYPQQVIDMRARLEEIRGTDTWLLYLTYSRGQAAYINDNWNFDRQFGVVGPFRDINYYKNLDDNTAITYNQIFQMFTNSDLCSEGTTQ